MAQTFGLRGIALSLPPDAPAEPVWAAVEAKTAPTDVEYSVVWRVQEKAGQTVSEEAQDLSQPDYQWTAPKSGGEYEISALIAAGDDSQAISGGSVAISVVTPPPRPTQPHRHQITHAHPHPARYLYPHPRPDPTGGGSRCRIGSAEAAPADKPAGPPPPAVAPVNVPFGYGIKADPRGNAAGNITAIQTLGFSWVKFQMPWKDVESQQNDFSWGPWDQVIDAYSNNGIKVLLSIPKAPNWARPLDDDKNVEGPPADPQLYADFVAKVADRYRGRVQAIEIWNEQNLWYEAGGVGRINAATYVDLLQRSYTAIKAINPQMIVVSGALTPAGNVGEYAVDDVIYLEQMYANGAKGFFDALGAHPSGYNCPATGD